MSQWLSPSSGIVASLTHPQFLTFQTSLNPLSLKLNKSTQIEQNRKNIEKIANRFGEKKQKKIDKIQGKTEKYPTSYLLLVYPQNNKKKYGLYFLNRMVKMTNVRQFSILFLSPWFPLFGRPRIPTTWLIDKDHFDLRPSLFHIVI